MSTGKVAGMIFQEAVKLAKGAITGHKTLDTSTCTFENGVLEIEGERYMVMVTVEKIKYHGEIIPFDAHRRKH